MHRHREHFIRVAATTRPAQFKSPEDSMQMGLTFVREYSEDCYTWFRHGGAAPSIEHQGLDVQLIRNITVTYHGTVAGKYRFPVKQGLDPEQASTVTMDFLIGREFDKRFLGGKGRPQITAPLDDLRPGWRQQQETRVATVREADWLWSNFSLLDFGFSFPRPARSHQVIPEWSGNYAKPLCKTIQVVTSLHGDCVGYLKESIRMGSKPTERWLGECVRQTQAGGKGAKDWHNRPSENYLKFMAALYRDVLLDGEAFVSVDVQQDRARWSGLRWVAPSKIHFQLTCPLCSNDIAACGFGTGLYGSKCAGILRAEKRERDRLAELKDKQAQQSLEIQIRELRREHRIVSDRRDARRAS